MTRNAKITNYIFALVALYFGGPSLIWGMDGFFGAFFVAVLALVLWFIWAAIYAIVEFNDE